MNLDESGEICEKKILFWMKKEADKPCLKAREWGLVEENVLALFFTNLNRKGAK